MATTSGEYRWWSDEELLAHREACIREARVQERWGDRQTTMYAKRCRDRTKVYWPFST